MLCLLILIVIIILLFIVIVRGCVLFILFKLVVSVNVFFNELSKCWWVVLLNVLYVFCRIFCVLM